MGVQHLLRGFVPPPSTAPGLYRHAPAPHRTTVDNDRLDPLRRVARRIPGAMALGRGLRRLIDPDLRTIERLRREQAAALFQPFPTTAEDRYPEFFAALAERLADIPRPRILSFGCADGAEVRSLRRYLPSAEIVGYDINPRAIAEARRRLALAPDPEMRFELAADPSAEPAERFDAVLAMAVFRHGELEHAKPASSRDIMPFARFEQGVAMLDRLVRRGGWLAIWNSHFRFGDTALAPAYEAEATPWSEGKPLTLLYGPENQRLAASYADMLFRKL